MNSYSNYSYNYMNNSNDTVNHITNTNMNTNNTNTNELLVRVSFLESENDRLRQAITHDQVSYNNINKLIMINYHDYVIIIDNNRRNYLILKLV